MGVWKGFQPLLPVRRSEGILTTMAMAGKYINQAEFWESLDQANQLFKLQRNEEGEETTPYKQEGQDQKSHEVIELSRRRGSPCGG